MAVTHYLEWTIERGEEATEICVDYEYHAVGCSAHYGSLTYPGHPAEPDEVEIVNVWRKSDEDMPKAPAFELTDEEYEKIENWILQNPPEPDYSGDY